MRVLILDGHCAAATEAAQSLGRQGASVDVASEMPDCLVFRSRYVASRLNQPPSDPPDAFFLWLRQRHAERRYEFIVPSTDVSLVLLRRLEEDDPLRLRAVLPGDAALDVAIDKIATCRLAERLGIPVPHSIIIPRGNPAPQCVRYPAVLKSSRSRVAVDGRSVRLEAQVVRDAGERERVLAGWLQHTDVQQQDFVTGRGFGIEMLFDRGRMLWYFAHERLHEMPMTGGGSCYRRSIQPPPELLSAAERLLRELAWHGVAMVEFRGHAPRFHLMEINPRLWGSLALAIDAGVDFPAGLATIATGGALPPQPQYRVPYYTRQLISDVQWHKENLRADRRDPLLLTRPRLRSALEMLRPLAGRESWDFFDWRDLGVIGRHLRQIIAWEAGRLLLRLTRLRARTRARSHHRRLTRAMAARGGPGELLFVCHGNICRSPVAAKVAERELSAAHVRSAGLHRLEHRASPQHVRRAALAAGVSLEVHRSRRMTAADAEQAGLILCMDTENLDMFRREFPDAYERATLLGLFADPPCLDIPDPLNASDAVTGDVIELISRAVLGLKAWMRELSTPGSDRAPSTAPNSPKAAR